MTSTTTPTHRSRAAPLALLAIISALLLPACAAYRLDSTFRRDVGTVAVPVFGNTTYAYGLEADLTDALIKEIHRTTPYKVVASQNADTIFEGTIIDTDLNTLVADAETGLGQELAVSITVNFEWRSRRSGEVYISRRSFTASDVFVPDRDAGERLETGQFRAVDRLAKDLVTELRDAW